MDRQAIARQHTNAAFEGFELLQRFKDTLTKRQQGLSKKYNVKRYNNVLVRIGRLKQKYSRHSLLRHHRRAR